jgi:hypothetical protein
MKAIIAKLSVLIVVLLPTLGLIVWFMIGDIANGGLVAMSSACVWIVSYIVVLSTDGSVK